MHDPCVIIVSHLPFPLCSRFSGEFTFKFEPDVTQEQWVPLTASMSAGTGEEKLRGNCAAAYFLVAPKRKLGWGRGDAGVGLISGSEVMHMWALL